MEFVAEHQLELTVMSEWDLNPVQFAELYRKVLRVNTAATQAQSFYKRMHADLSGSILNWDDDTADPSNDKALVYKPANIVLERRDLPIRPNPTAPTS